MPFTKYTFIISVLLLSIVYSCKDKTPEPSGCAAGTPCQSVLVAKDFFLFKPGSYWVYEEENSHVRDSMYVYSYANGSDYTFDIVIKSALDNFQYHYWPEYNGQPNDELCSKTAPILKRCMAIKRSKGIPGSPGVSLGENRCMTFQYILNDSVPSPNYLFPSNWLHINEIKESYSLGNFVFGPTVKTYVPHDRQDNDHPTYHYFSKGIGLVRKELVDTPEVWNLVNYYIAP